MSLGSGLFTKSIPYKAHILKNRMDGLGGEIAKLRADILAELAPMAALAIEEWTNAPASADDLIKLDFATSTSAQVITGAGLDGTVGGHKFIAPRTVCVTQDAGLHYTHLNVTVKGLDAQGKAVTDTLLLLATGGPNTVGGVKFFAQILEIDIPGQVDTGGVLSFGLGLDSSASDTKKLGLSRSPKARTGALFIQEEYVDGSLVTSGALTLASSDAPYGSYTPSAAPNGAHDYSIVYEYDATA